MILLDAEKWYSEGAAPRVDWTLEDQVNVIINVGAKLGNILFRIECDNFMNANFIFSLKRAFKFAANININLAIKIFFKFSIQGWIFGAFNAGLLCMLVTGFLADKFNAK